MGHAAWRGAGALALAGLLWASTVAASTEMMKLEMPAACRASSWPRPCLRAPRHCTCRARRGCTTRWSVSRASWPRSRRSWTAPTRSTSKAPAPTSNGPLVLERIHNDWVVAPDYKITKMDDRTGQLAGAYVGRMLDGQVLIGGAGYWLANRSRDFELAYVGLLLGWQSPEMGRIRFGARSIDRKSTRLNSSH